MAMDHEDWKVPAAAANRAMKKDKLHNACLSWSVTNA